MARGTATESSPGSPVAGEGDPGRLRDRGTQEPGTQERGVAVAVRRVDVAIEGRQAIVQVTPVSGAAFKRTVQGLPDLAPGPAVWVYQRGQHELVRDGRVLWYSLGGDESFRTFGLMMERTAGPVPVWVSGGSLAASAARPGTRGAGGGTHPL